MNTRIRHATDLSPREIATCLGRLCRYAGRGKFASVLNHVLAVSDFLPDNLKFWGLVHDQAEAITNDVVSCYKTDDFRKIEDDIFAEMCKHQGVRLPTRWERSRVKHADHRSRSGEIWSGAAGDPKLRETYPVRDAEAEKITKHYARKYPPTDTIRGRCSKAVAEYCRRYHAYRKLMEA